MKRRVRGRGSSFESFRRITTDRAGEKVRPRDKVKLDLRRSMVIENAARLVCGALLPRLRWCREQLQL